MNKRIEVYSLRASILRPRGSLAESIINSIRTGKVRPSKGDIVAVASKTLAISQGRLTRLADVHPTKRAKFLARRFEMLPAFVQVILDESDEIYSGVHGALLTLKDGDAVANAGVDLKNAPNGYAVLWPENPSKAARRIRARLEKHYKKRLGVVVVDSRVTPLRLGTIGIALGTAGFRPVEDFRGIRDLYGRQNRITSMAMADGIADIAHMAMGESGESSPYALIRNAPVTMDGVNRDKRALTLPIEDCLYMSSIKDRGSRV